MRVRSIVLTGLLASGSARLVAHTAEAHDWYRPGAMSAWDLAALAMLLVTATLYVRGVRRLRGRGGVQPLRERVAFACGWSTLVFAVLPPLDSLSIQLFSIHMIQHELMMLVGAPLLVGGRPFPTCLWGLPDRWRASVAAAFRAQPVGRLWRALTAPIIAWALHGIVLWIWHAPALYDRAVGNEGVHALQHAMFVATAAFFWWGLLAGRYGRAGYGAAVFYVFTTVVHTGLLGAMLTFAPVPLYGAYLSPAAARGIDPLADQQVAGLLMWIPAGTILTVLGLALFAAWLGEAERRSARSPEARSS